MFCQNCGKEIDDNAAICINCGVAIKKKDEIGDNGGLGWGLLGCCIPIVGLVLFLIWQDSKPKNAKAAGIGALITVIVYILFYALAFMIGMSNV